jgi:hypothetical protein
MQRRERRQESLRLPDKESRIIDELVRSVNEKSIGKVTRHSVIVDLVARGLRSLPRKSATSSANASVSSESNTDESRPSGEG